MAKQRAKMSDVTIGNETILRDNSINRYFSDIKCRTKQLTPNEEAELFIEYNQTKSEIIKHKIAEANLRFVISIAKMCYIKNNTLSMNDYIQWGNIGLVDAIDLFDVTRGYKFISYAVFHIRKELYKNMNEFRRVRLPLNVVAIESKINKFSDKFLSENEFSLTIFEIAEHLKEDGLIKAEDFVHGLAAFSRDYSIDESVPGIDELQIHETIESEEDIPLTDKADNKYKWNELLSVLRIDYRIMIEMFYGIGRQAESIETIAKVYECTKENIRKHIDNNVKILKEYASARKMSRAELV